MAQRNKIIQTKQLEVNANIHHKIKTLAFQHDVEMRALADALIYSILDDEKRIEEVIAGLQEPGS